MPSPDSTLKKRRKVLAALEQGRSVATACRAGTIDRKTYYNWRKADEQFAADADEAIEAGTDLLEDKLYDRAAETDTTAAIFLLKARRPEKYRDNLKVEHSGTISFADLHAVAGQAVSDG